MSIRGNGEPSPWFRRTIDELKENTAELREMVRETKIRIARAEDEIQIMKQDLAENRRQTRELMVLVAKIDERDRRDTAALAKLLAQHNMRLERLEKKK